MKDKWQAASKVVGEPLLKLLGLKSGVPGIGDAAAGALAVGAKMLDEQAANRPVTERIDALAEQILKKHAAQFDYENVAVDAEAVGKALATALGALSKRPVEKIVAENLDPARLLKLAEAENAGAALSGADRELFDAALPDLIKAVVDLAPELKGFAGASTGEILRRLDNVNAGLVTVSTGMAHLAGDYAEWEEEYFRHVVQSNNRLELFGSDIDKVARRIDLSRAYVRLTMTGAGIGEAHSGGAETLFDRVAQIAEGKAGRALVLGHAGAGKTTLLRWAAVTAGGSRARDYNPERREWRALVPVIIRLRDIENTPDVANIGAWIGKGPVGEPPAGWVKQILKSGRALVMIDGVDEIDPAARVKCGDALEQLCTLYPETTFIVTSRPAAVESDWLADLGFIRAEINPLAGADQEDLIGKWFAAVGPKEEISDEMMAEQLREKLRQTPRLALLASNPLMLSMLCALFYRTPKSMPDRPFDLVDRLAHLLTFERDKERDIDVDPAWTALDQKQKRNLLQEIAFSMVFNDGPGSNSVLLMETLDRTLLKVMEEMGRAVQDPASFRRAVIDRSGLLREASHEHVEFLHNTFKEFLAAQALIDRQAIGMLTKNAADREWWPVIMFAASGGGKFFAEKLVTELLKDNVFQRSTSRTRQCIAYVCGRNAVGLSPDIQEKLGWLENVFLPPENMEDAAILALGGEALANKLLKIDLCSQSPEVRAASIRTLRLIDPVKAKTWCRIFLDDHSYEVWVELFEISNILDNEWYFEYFIYNNTQNDFRRFIVNLSPLVGLTDLQDLNLMDTQVTDLSPLAGLTKLQFLNLSGTQVADLSALAGLTNLQFLDLSRTQVADLSPLAELINLQFLDLSRTKAVDLSPLTGLTNVIYLGLRGTHTFSLASLAELTNLNYLDLWEAQVVDLSPLAGLNNLKYLDLSRTQVSDMLPLANLKKLKRLYLSRTQITDLSPLICLNDLEILFLTNTQIMDLSPLRHLQGKCKIYR
jgi:hypothetical protein